MTTLAVEVECRCPQCGSERTERIREVRLDSWDDDGLGVQGARPGGRPTLFDRRCERGHVFAESIE